MEETTSSVSSVINEVGQQVSENADKFIDGADKVIQNNEVVKSFKELLGENVLERFWDFLPGLVIAVITILLGIFTAKLITKIVIKGMKKHGTDPSIYTFVRTIIKFTVYIIAIISALSSLGLNISSLVAALASVGVAIGLGLQNSVSQLFSGIMIIVNKPFKSGDFIEVKGVSGCVKHIHIMYTTILTVDNKKIIMPNSDLTANHIINYSAEDKRRCDLKFAISYSDDISSARDLILNAVSKCEYALLDPAPVVMVTAHEASSVQLELRCWCSNENYWNLYFAMEESVKLAFDENGISIPFSQLDVHIVNK